MKVRLGLAAVLVAAASFLAGCLPNPYPPPPVRKCHLVPNGPFAVGQHLAYIDNGEKAPNDCVRG